jgi:hypothetical protein
MHEIQLRTGIWHELVNEGIDATDDAAFLEGFGKPAWLIAADVSIVSCRAWIPVLMWLDARLDSRLYRKDVGPRYSLALSKANAEPFRSLAAGRLVIMSSECPWCQKWRGWLAG